MIPINSNIPIDANQFQRLLPQLNQTTLQQLVLYAQQQGMNQQDIDAGLKYINNLLNSR
jgi:hypothetical protein